MRQPTPRQLLVFETVCRTGSIKAAAHELGISERTVTRQLSAMYRRLGVDSAGQAAWVLWRKSAIRNEAVLVQA